jgi:anti-repressor protein
MMSEIIRYIFEGAAVRVITRDGEPWFVLVDICKVLEIRNSREAAGRLDVDEKGVTQTDTLGGSQQMT